MARVDDLQRRVSRLQATVADRDRTIRKLRGDLSKATGQIVELRGVLQEVADGLKPLGGLTSTTTRLADALTEFSDGGIDGIGRYGQLLPLLTEGPLSSAADLAKLAASSMSSAAGGSGAAGGKLQQALTDIVEQVESVVGGLPDLPKPPLRPLLGQVTALIEAAPDEMRARLETLWESSGLFDWVAATQQTLHDPQLHIASLQALASICGIVEKIIPADVDGGGEAAGGAAAAGGGGASVRLVSLSKATLGVLTLAIDVMIIVMRTKLALEPAPEE